MHSKQKMVISQDSKTNAIKVDDHPLAKHTEQPNIGKVVFYTED